MRQAVDALNNRTVRIMPVVKFPVVILAPSFSTMAVSQASTSACGHTPVLTKASAALAPIKCVKDSVPMSNKSTAPLPAKLICLNLFILTFI